jgi:ribonuclease
VADRAGRITHAYGDLASGRLDDDFNLYAYVGDDPINHIDPTGLECGTNIPGHVSAGCSSAVMESRSIEGPSSPAWQPQGLPGQGLLQIGNRKGHFRPGQVMPLPTAPDESKLDPNKINPFNPITTQQQQQIAKTFNDLETGDYVKQGLPIKVYFNFPSFKTGAQLPLGYNYVEFTVANPAVTHRGTWRLVLGVSKTDDKLPIRIYYTNTHYDSFYRIVLYPGEE